MVIIAVKWSTQYRIPHLGVISFNKSLTTAPMWVFLSGRLHWKGGRPTVTSPDSDTCEYSGSQATTDGFFWSG